LKIPCHKRKTQTKASSLVEQAIDLTRKLAKGVFPLELEGEGLIGALLELAGAPQIAIT
jgi:hypothetical protein